MRHNRNVAQLNRFIPMPSYIFYISSERIVATLTSNYTQMKWIETMGQFISVNFMGHSRQENQMKLITYLENWSIECTWWLCSVCKIHTETIRFTILVQLTDACHILCIGCVIEVTALCADPTMTPCDWVSQGNLLDLYVMWAYYCIVRSLRVNRWVASLLYILSQDQDTISCKWNRRWQRWYTPCRRPKTPCSVGNV